jgi:tetratricopeptide (TPR) repeat protein
MTRGAWFLAAVVAFGPGPAAAQVDLRRDLELEPPRPGAARPSSPQAQRHRQALDCFLRGQLLERGRRLPEAVKAYEEALKLEPDAVSVYNALIPLCFNLDRNAQALEYCRRVLPLQPDNFELQARYGLELREKGETAEAVRVLERAVRIPAARQQPPQLIQALFTLGSAQEDLKQHRAAAATYEQIAELLQSPDTPLPQLDPHVRKQVTELLVKTYERIAKVSVQAQDYDSALAALRKAQEKDPDRAVTLNFNLAEVHLARKRPGDALECLRTYLATQPTGAEAYELLIEVLRQLGREQEVIPTLERAAQRDSFNQPLRLLLARSYAAAGRGDRAEKLYDEALADYPSEDAYKGLAELYRKQGRWAELARRLDDDFADPRRLALAKAQTAVLASDPELLKGVAQAARAAGRPLEYKTRRLLAALCRQAKQYDLAEHFCRLCLPDDPQPGEAYVELCRILQEAGKYAEEAEVCRQAATQNLKVPALAFRLERATALALAGRAAEAVAAAEEALTGTTPGSKERQQAAFTLAAVYYRTNQLDRAAEEARKLLAASDDAAGRRQLRQMLAGIYSAQRDYRRAEEQLEELLDSDPDDATVCNDLGYLWAEQEKNLVEAEKLIRKAIELDRVARAKKAGVLEIPPAERDNAAYIDSLGWVLFKQGQAEAALGHLERAGRLQGGDDPVIFEHLGDVYQALGRPADARGAYDKALELYRAGKRPGAEGRRKELLERLRR